ncbi:MAG TPA: DUF2255 family protein [Candidatus Limnocylindrales bacterium]|nr:DUF2255 family protein [Candidatus Limnocylindrales bacterium]
MTEPSFDPEMLARLRDLKEVDIETRSAGGDVHPATIWVVVDASNRVLVRSWRGAGARWYREAVAAGEGSLIVDGATLPVRIERATDPERIAACSERLLAKYGGGSTARSMVRDEVLDTTLEIRPG